MAFDIEECLRFVVEREGSDLHVKVNSPPMARIHGSLQPLPDHEPLRPEDTEAALRSLIGDERNREEFTEEGETDFSYELKGVSRFRVNAFRQRGAVSIVCRAIPFQVRTIDDLGLPNVIRTLADEQRGIILLTGTTGSGKSTTLAAMIDHINNRYPHHIITLEDPIEYLHRDKRSIINQREVGSDTQSFGRAMRRVLRQDPDVILVGEMRDEETVRTALSAAETGHLVLSTLHTLDATETINRIIDFFPPHLQQQARVMLAGTLKGAVSQRLVPTSDGDGRLAASEILVVTGRVQDLILNPNETGKISQVIAEGEYYGMQTFDQSLLEHVMRGRVSEATAMEYASSPHDFKLMLASAGKRASDLEQILEGDDGPGPLLQTDLGPATAATTVAGADPTHEDGRPPASGNGGAPDPGAEPDRLHDAGPAPPEDAPSEDPYGHSSPPEPAGAEVEVAPGSPGDADEGTVAPSAPLRESADVGPPQVPSEDAYGYQSPPAPAGAEVEVAPGSPEDAYEGAPPPAPVDAAPAPVEEAHEAAVAPSAPPPGPAAADPAPSREAPAEDAYGDASPPEPAGVEYEVAPGPPEAAPEAAVTPSAPPPVDVPQAPPEDAYERSVPPVQPTPGLEAATGERHPDPAGGEAGSVAPDDVAEADVDPGPPPGPPPSDGNDEGYYFSS